MQVLTLKIDISTAFFAILPNGHSICRLWGNQDSVVPYNRPSLHTSWQLL
jgi:hypothetical protein